MKKVPTVINWIFIFAFGIILWNRMQYKKSEEFNYEIPKNYKSFGIDVSHHQGEIDWHSILSHQFTPHLDFIYLKATEGKDHIDSQWKQNRKQLLKAKKKHGAYHFFRPYTDPVLQAQHFLNHYKVEVNDLPPVIDVEVESSSDEQLVKDVTLYIKEIENKTGRRPIIYTSYHFYLTKFRNEFEDYKFWIAAYTKPFVVPKDERILYWQFTDQASLPFHKGIKVDLNVGRVHFE